MESAATVLTPNKPSLEELNEMDKKIDRARANIPTMTQTSQRKPVVITDTLPDGFKLPRRKAETLGLVFSGLEQYGTTAEQVAWLRHNNSPGLQYLLQLAHDPHVEWLLPPGLPPYRPFTVRRGGRVVPLRVGQAPSELMSELRRMYVFLKGGNDTMSREKREKVFQEIIEGMDPMEVDVFLALKDKKFGIRFCSKELVDMAFPHLLDQPFRLKFMRG